MIDRQDVIERTLWGHDPIPSETQCFTFLSGPPHGPHRPPVLNKWIASISQASRGTLLDIIRIPFDSRAKKLKKFVFIRVYWWLIYVWRREIQLGSG
jgi:hypothetical protein